MTSFHHSRQEVKRVANFISGDNEVDWNQDFRLIANVQEHPLFTFKELLPTEPVNELFTKVKRAILLRKTSVCLGAPSGAGKSSALDVLRAMIAQAYPDLPTFLHDTHNHQIPSIRAFFKNFLVTVGHAQIKGETFDLKHRLFNTLIDTARVRSQKSLLLLIDEAQAMDITDFNFLKDVYNTLARAGIQQTSVLMGQEPDLSNLLNRLHSDSRLDLINRFAISPDQFRTYRTRDDIYKIFDAIDHAEYPPGSNVTWTMAFFPYQWSKGFRLSNETDNFVEAVAKFGFPRKENFSMPARQTFLTIRSFFIENASFDEARPIATDAWQDALEEARMELAMELGKDSQIV